MAGKQADSDPLTGFCSFCQLILFVVWHIIIIIIKKHDKFLGISVRWNSFNLDRYKTIAIRYLLREEVER